MSTIHHLCTRSATSRAALMLATALALAALLALPHPAGAQGSATSPGAPGMARTAISADAPSDTVAAATCPAPVVLDFSQGDLSGHGSEFARLAELAGAAPLRSWLIRRTAEEAQLTLCAPAATVPWARNLRERYATREYPGHRARRDLGARHDIDEHRYTGERNTLRESLDHRAPGAPTPSASPRLRVTLLAPRLGATLNSAYPDDRNNGALWAGRGLGGELSGGVAFNWGSLSGALLPAVLYQENRAFEVVTTVRPPGHSPWVYPWSPGTIDWPQRFGERRQWTTALGQSYLQFEERGLALTLSTENLWWGPAQRNPLLLSNTAPGFAHLAFGTTRPQNVGIGALEARAIWGRLEESPYYDGEVHNDDRIFAGLTATIQPYAIPGLFLGFARAHILQLDGLALHRQALAPIWSMGGRDPLGADHPGYQLISLFGRWAFPDAGFEAYAEWATRARWTGPDDLLREPGRDQAYLVGFQYLIPAGGHWIRTYGEHVQLAGSPKAARDGGPQSFYTDPRIVQGHTHRGQLLGAAIGPGSDAQILGLDLFTARGQIGLFAERTRRDEDTYFTVWTRYYGRDGHDIALSGGIRQLLFLGDYTLSWRLTHESRRNRNFLRLDGANWDLLRETNWGLHVELGWRPRMLRY